MDYAHEIPRLLTVPNKNQKVVPFHLKRLQADWLDRTALRKAELKPRQGGQSSVILARNVLKIASTPNTTCLVITHESPSTQRFRRRILHHIADLRRQGRAPRVTIDNKDELVFGLLDSGFIFQTAGMESSGRSFTANILHASEVAHWKGAGEVLGGALESVPQDGGIVDIESTPNGDDGPFHDICTAAQEGAKYGEHSYDLCFYPWWWEGEYRIRGAPKITDLTDHEAYLKREYGLDDEQLYWRRIKQAELATLGIPFEQEYPEDPVTCFLGGKGRVFSLQTAQRLRQGVRPPIELWPVYPAREELRVYVKPQGGHSYVCIVDCSEGTDKGDPSAIQVLDGRTFAQAACMDFYCDPDDVATVAVQVARRFNEAHLAIERNGIGQAVVKRAQQDHNYPNLYYDIDPDSPRGVVHYRPGWQTNARTRPLAIASLIEAVNGGELVVYDEKTVRQLTNLAWAEARKGGRIPLMGKMRRIETPRMVHDDLAMALAIGVEVRKQAPVAVRPQPQEEEWAHGYGSGRPW